MSTYLVARLSDEQKQKAIDYFGDAALLFSISLIATVIVYYGAIKLAFWLEDRKARKAQKKRKGKRRDIAYPRPHNTGLHRSGAVRIPHIRLDTRTENNETLVRGKQPAEGFWRQY